MQHVPTAQFDPNTQSTSDRLTSSSLFLKPGVSLNVKKLSYDGETVVRLFPSLSYENPQETYPMLMATDQSTHMMPGRWIFRADSADGVGLGMVNFFVGQPNRRGFDPKSTPLAVLFFAINKATKAGQARPNWYEMMKDNPNRPKNLGALAVPKEIYLTQGVVLKNGKQDEQPLFQVGDDPVNNPSFTSLIKLSGDIGKYLLEQIRLEKAGYSGDMGNINERFVYGDIVDPDYGKFIVFFKEDNGHIARSYTSIQPPIACAYTARFNPQTTNTFRRYDLCFLNSYCGLSPQITNPTRVQQSWNYWENILEFPSEMEQVDILCDVYPNHLTALAYAFKDYPHWISERAKGLLRDAEDNERRQQYNQAQAPYQATANAGYQPQVPPQYQGAPAGSYFPNAQPQNNQRPTSQQPWQQAPVPPQQPMYAPPQQPMPQQPPVSQALAQPVANGNPWQNHAQQHGQQVNTQPQNGGYVPQPPPQSVPQAAAPSQVEPATNGMQPPTYQPQVPPQQFAPQPVPVTGVGHGGGQHDRVLDTVTKSLDDLPEPGSFDARPSNYDGQTKQQASAIADRLTQRRNEQR